MPSRRRNPNRVTRPVQVLLLRWRRWLTSLVQRGAIHWPLDGQLRDQRLPSAVSTNPATQPGSPIAGRVRDVVVGQPLEGVQAGLYAHVNSW